MIGSAEPSASPSRSLATLLWSVMRLPTQILLTGGAVLVLLWASTRFHFAAFERLVAALSGADLVPSFVAVLFFLVGLSFAVFLWWMVGRYFSVMTSGKMSPEALAAIKDLPVGLPEGTVRAVLALIVAVMGLPLLLFSHALSLSTEISGYLNGIIAGVFGYYFGSRTTGVPARAMNQIVDANGRAAQAEGAKDAAQKETAVARNETAVAKVLVSDAARASSFAPAVSRLSRDLAIGSSILDVIAPALPAGILPAGLSTAVSTAKSALDAVQGTTPATATDAEQQIVNGALGAVLGTGGSSSLSALLAAAAPMLAGLGIPGLTPASALVALMSVGARLGSQEFQRWRARVLAAPLAHGLLEFGTVTPDDARMALQSSPIFAKAFAEEHDQAGVDGILADAVLRDDALDRLWKIYGGSTPGQPALFATQADLAAGMSEFGQALLAGRAAHDVPATLPPLVSAVLAQAANPALRPSRPDVLSPDSINQIIDAAARASAAGTTVPVQAHAAFDALVMLVGHARQNGVDLVGALAEAAP